MAKSDDGGYHALAGYLFQLLGSARLAAESLGQLPDAGTDISARFSVVKLESHGQDAELVSTEEDSQRTRQLVQFKYSGTPTKYPIEPHHLIEILERFRESEARANDIEMLPVTFLLVSNRQLSESAQKVVDAGKGGQPCEQLDAVEETHNGQKKHEGRTKANNAKYRLILKRLTCELVDEEDCRQAIAKRARAFGMLDSELGDGVNRLIAAFFGRAASVANRKITGPELDRELVGYQDPRRLDDDSLRQVLLNGIAAKKRFLQVPSLQILHRQELQDPMISSRALVIVSGDGGTGKSVAACQIVEAAILASEGSPPPFTAIESVHDVTALWVAELVARWRNTTEPSHRSELATRAIDRLIAATSGAPPILQLALDGIDEIGLTPEHCAVGQILRFFDEEDQRCQAEQRPPKAVLVVTCRDPEDVYSGWIHHGGFPSHTDDGNVLRLTRFNDLQLCEIASRVLAEDVASRIQFTASLAARSGIHVRTAFSTAVDSFVCPAPSADSPAVELRAVATEVFEALKHPALWRVFSEGLADEEEQHRVLDGDPASLGTFTRSFVDWLCSKIKLRRNAVLPDATRAMLCRIASAFDDPQRTSRIKEDWIQPAVSVTGCAEQVARNVFREMESLGLVVRVDKERWRWQHPFMCEHLAGLDF